MKNWSIPPMDIRRIRAQRLTASIMQELTPLLQDDQTREVREAIYGLLWRSGAEVLTDHERRELGLPDRGNNGWTQEELHILELKRTEALLNPMQPFLMKTEVKGDN